LSLPLSKRENLETTMTRTLLASGYHITAADRHQRHLEIECERRSRLGVLIRFRVAFTESPAFDLTDIKAIQQTAELQGRAVIFVAQKGRPGQISWAEFLNVMGGPVPSWRALNDSFKSALMQAAKNKKPRGMNGEPWAILEELTADGLQFLLGRRVSRFGGRRRGLRVSDMICPLSDSSILVVDTKAYASGLKVTWPSLRPLKEYVEQQVQYQAQRMTVSAALVVSSSFRPRSNRLQSVCHEFFATTRVPLCLMEARTLVTAVDTFRKQPDIRNSVRWERILSGGLITVSDMQKQIKRVTDERFDPGDL